MAGTVFYAHSCGPAVVPLQDGDQLKWVAKCREDDNVLVASSDGALLVFPVAEGLLPSGRQSRGCKVRRISCLRT